MSLLLYQISISCYGFFIRMASLFNQKAKLWIAGREGLSDKIDREYGGKHQKIIWMHCASAGEFEQGRPVLEQLKIKFPDRKIVLTFFSPSGYELRKNYKGADAVYYLPLDTKRNARRFIKALSPEWVIFVKYEFWLNYLFELHHNHIPVILISAIFRPSQIFFKSYGKIFQQALHNYHHIFVQDEESMQLLHTIGVRQVSVSGDTRFDRVSDIVKQKQEIPHIATFVNNCFCIVAGSTWPEDEYVLARAGKPLQDVKWIIVPHEIDEHHIQLLAQQWPTSIRYSQIKDTSLLSTVDALIIDSVGLLSVVYRYADVAYIGGGFSKGIHNILEAAVYGVPVLFGPNYQKFREARELIEAQAAYSIGTSDALSEIITTFKTNLAYRKDCGHRASAYVNANRGATLQIINTMNDSLSANQTI